MQGFNYRHLDLLGCSSRFRRVSYRAGGAGQHHASLPQFLILPERPHGSVELNASKTRRVPARAGYGQVNCFRNDIAEVKQIQRALVGNDGCFFARSQPRRQDLFPG